MYALHHQDVKKMARLLISRLLMHSEKTCLYHVE
jgi:hypothetical protein